MKIVKKNREYKEKLKKKHVVKPKKEHVLIVAQEIKFARLLSGNEKKARDRVLKTLKKWLLNCFQKGYEFKEEDFTRVWKGLFYAVWMSDKPLIQEELCENIAAILDVFPPEQIRHAILMTKAGLKVLATEWYGIDQHRMDKFLMLVRRYLRGSLRCLHRCEWSMESCTMYSKMLSASDGLLALKTPHYARNATSMVLHFTDCYLEELSKVSGGSIPPAALAEVLRPFVRRACLGAAGAACLAARRVLTALVRQTELGLRYQDTTAAWQQMGCPEGGPEALELVSDDEAGDDDEEGSDEEETGALDPRAGRVHVSLAPLAAPAGLLADMLRDMLAHTASRAHKRTRLLMQRFEQLSRDEYPLRVEQPPRDDQPAPSLRASARSLHALEKTLLQSSDELALRGLSRKHRKRLAAKSRAGLSILDDIDMIHRARNTSTDGDWEVEPTEPVAKKPKTSDKTNTQDTSNKENQHKNKKNKKQTDKPKTQETKRKNDQVNGDIKKQKIDKKPKQTKPVKEVLNDSKKTVEATNKVENQLILNVTTKPRQKQMKPTNKTEKPMETKPTPSVVKNYQKQTQEVAYDTPKKVKFVLKNNSMQKPVDYYKSVRQSPSIPYDSSKKPTKTNLKPSTPSPINPFLKKKLKMRK